MLAVGLLVAVRLQLGDGVVVPVALPVLDLEEVGEGLVEGVTVGVVVDVRLVVLRAGWALLPRSMAVACDVSQPMHSALISA